jgi:hypothetical protein
MSNLKEFKIDEKSLIGGSYISKDICKNIIDYYEKNKHLHYRGTVRDGISDNSKKESSEIALNVNSFVNLFPDYINELEVVLKNYKKKYKYSNEVYYYNLNENIKIQHYKKNEGFKVWHSENDGSRKVIKRHLVFMTYLNTVDDAGTDFLYQDLTTKAEEGLTLIWPAHWTHTHKGQISKHSEKYIVTGWFSFNE